jgi:hypothetical protein
MLKCVISLSVPIGRAAQGSDLFTLSFLHEHEYLEKTEDKFQDVKNHEDACFGSVRDVTLINIAFQTVKNAKTRP